MRKKVVKLLVAVTLIGGVALGVKISSLLPRKDYVKVTELPSRFMLSDNENYIQYQSGYDCAGYAAAYVLRHLGHDVEGVEIFRQMDKVSDGVNLPGVKGLFKQYGYRAKPLYGTIDTMKMNLVKGQPVIVHTVFIGDSTHYTVVVGYDEEYVYLADSAREKVNCFDSTTYNRKLTYQEFERIWKTDSYPMDNVYITVEKMK